MVNPRHVWNESLNKKFEEEYATLGARKFIEKYGLPLTRRQVSNHAVKFGLSMTPEQRSESRAQNITQYNSSDEGRQMRSKTMKNVWRVARRNQ